MAFDVSSHKGSTSNRWEWVWRVVIGIVCLAAGFFVAWRIEYNQIWQGTPSSGGRRLATPYDLVGPLLTCNISGNENFSSSRTLAAKITAAINAQVSAGNISSAAVFVQDMDGGTWADVNQNDRFYPASLGKVPVMMAYYKEAEMNPSVLDESIPYLAGGQNLNLQQEIVPSSSIMPGRSYTVDQLIASMIDYSDNNAADLLTQNIDQNSLEETYGDLGVPTLNDPNINNYDFMDVADFSRFFRVLYNATYLTPAMSEKVLEQLTQTNFTQGIVAGVPAGTTVAHKFGLTSLESGGAGTPVTSRELHDCGIVYATDHPYALCVMTKSTSSIPQIETAIANISEVVYQEVENDYK